MSSSSKWRRVECKSSRSNKTTFGNKSKGNFKDNSKKILSNRVTSSKWNDNRKTDAFKSTRKMKTDRNIKENDFMKPNKTRIWKDKLIRTIETNKPIENRQWKREEKSESDDNLLNVSFITNKKEGEPPKIESKWTAKREKREESVVSSNREREPEIKSFNKKIKIIERKTRGQIEAEKKAVYDSFIKESFILKLDDHLGEKKEGKLIHNDAWGSDSDVEYDLDSNLSEFDKWERDMLQEIDGDEDDVEIVNKKRRAFFSRELECFREYYEIPAISGEYVYSKDEDNRYKEEHRIYLMKRLMGLSILPTLMLDQSNVTDGEIKEAYDSMYHFMISKNMKVVDMSYDYNIERLLDFEDKVLRKEFIKLRKKYNSIKKIYNKIMNKEKVHKEEKEKYNNRHETVFLYHRLRMYDLYYMDGKLELKNNMK